MLLGEPRITDRSVHGANLIAVNDRQRLRPSHPPAANTDADPECADQLIVIGHPTAQSITQVGQELLTHCAQPLAGTEYVLYPPRRSPVAQRQVQCIV